MKTFKFSLVLRTRENTDVFITLDDNIYGIHSKRVNILYIFWINKMQTNAETEICDARSHGSAYTTSWPDRTGRYYFFSSYFDLHYPEYESRQEYGNKVNFPADTQRQNNVVRTSSRRRPNDVVTTFCVYLVCSYLAFITILHINAQLLICLLHFLGSMQ